MYVCQIRCIWNGILFSHEHKDMLSHDVTWKNLEGIILSEISQLQKDKYCTVPFM